MVLLGGFSKQILHRRTRAVIVDEYIKTQASEALEEGLRVFVRPIPDIHTCCYVKVLVVYDDAFSHLLKIHVVLVSGLSDPGGLDWAWRDIFLLFLL